MAGIRRGLWALTLRMLGAALLATMLGGSYSRAQQPTGLTDLTRKELEGILRDAHGEVKGRYYDPNYGGVDWDARYKQYQTKIANARNLDEGFRIVAAFLSGLKDSHTLFFPPERVAKSTPGYELLMVGDECYVSAVRPGTDAENKLHVGDKVLHVNVYDVNRQDFFDLSYFFQILAPTNSPRFDLLSPSGERKAVEVAPLMQTGKPVRDEIYDFRFGKSGYWEEVRRQEDEERRTQDLGDALVWKPLQFDFTSVTVKTVIDKARTHKTLILDLRGNDGGFELALESLVGSLFDHVVKIADRVGKEINKPMIAKKEGHPFNGNLIVLVDSGSASASELLARVVQLEHRGKVIGDKTAGEVMEAKYHPDGQQVQDSAIYYGFTVTDANLIMRDGQSLEKVGVTPDEVRLPTGADLASGRDPVLAGAAEEAGVKLDPAAAGKFFPIEWKPF